MRLSHRPQGFGESWGLMPTQHAVTFLDNHDTQVHYLLTALPTYDRHAGALLYTIVCSIIPTLASPSQVH